MKIQFTFTLGGGDLTKKVTIVADCPSEPSIRHSHHGFILTPIDDFEVTETELMDDYRQYLTLGPHSDSTLVVEPTGMAYPFSLKLPKIIKK